MVQGKGNNSKSTLFKRTVSENIRRAASITEKGDGLHLDPCLHVMLLLAAAEFVNGSWLPNYSNLPGLPHGS